MIRTLDWTAVGDERSEAWLLVPQIDHAVLSGKLAQAWLGLEHSVALERVRKELIWAALHHDDGWLEWDHAPKLDSDGRPISFHEMHRDDSRPLWTHSIELAEARSPIAAILVAEHFVRLDSSSSDDHTSEFSEHFADKIAEWRTLASRNQQTSEVNHAVNPDLVSEDRVSADLDGSADLDDALDDAVALLRLFDWVSLLICMGRLDAPEQLRFPDESSWQLQYLGENQFHFLPWPFAESPWTQTLNAVRVPARPWTDVSEMFAAGERLKLELEFR